MYPIKIKQLLHGADYNPEQWISYPGILEKDIELMKKANMNCVSVGIFSWAKLEPSEGVYELDWLGEIIDKLYENGIYTILATPSGARPLWMSEKYEETRRVNRNMTREFSGGRHNHCYTSPIYREKVKTMDSMLAKRFAKHEGVILWHLSNEYGGTCYCPKCQAAFREWLKEKYKTLDALNHAWWTTFWSHTYTDWEQIHAPVPYGEMSTHGLNIDWRRFATSQTADFIAMERDAVKAENPDLPVTANLMYYFNDYDYTKLAREIDIVSWDSYPLWHEKDDIAEASNFALWHDYIRCLKKQPFLLMESTPSTTNWRPISKLKKPGMHVTSSMQAVAHGSNSVQYFQFRKSRGSSEKFHGAVVDHEGSENTRVFRDVADVGCSLKALEGVSAADNCSKAAIIYDAQSRWAVEDAQGPRNCGIHYVETVQEHYRAFWEMGINVDVIDSEDDFSGYSLVVAPMLYMLRRGVAGKMKAFVAGGGTLVTTCHSGIVDDTDLSFLGGLPGDGLMELFGIWNEEIDALYDGEKNGISYAGDEYSVTELCALVHLRGAKSLGNYMLDFYAGSPALTVNSFGKGEAYYMAGKGDSRFLADFYSDIALKLKLPAALDEVPPKGVEAVTREAGDCKYLFLQNYSGEEQNVNIPAGYKDTETGESVSKVRLLECGNAVLYKG